MIDKNFVNETNLLVEDVLTEGRGGRPDKDVMKIMGKMTKANYKKLVKELYTKHGLDKYSLDAAFEEIDFEDGDEHPFYNDALKYMEKLTKDD